ncbi:MAG: heme-copper oxidase subunit III [Caulobacterales bacterium]|jgi:heme/copper-type cytochrome/quinol oxidase subunit 3
MSEADFVPTRLPFGSFGKKGVGWWGMLCLVATEACLFGYLLFSYAFTAIQMGPSWQPAAPPSVKLALPNTIILLVSSVAVWFGERGIKRGRRGQLLAGVGAAIVLGAVFIAVQLKEWSNKPYRINTSGYASHYFTITGFHMAHVALGLLALIAVFLWGALGYFDRQRNTAVLVTSVYWHFVDVVWLCVFSAFYIAPYLMTP